MWLFYFSYSLSKHCVGLSHDSMQQLVVSSQTYTSICGRDAFSVFFCFFFSLHCTLSTPVFATLSARALVLHSILSRGCCVVFKGVRIFHLGARKSKRRLGNNYKWPMHSFAVAVMPCFSADAGDCNKVREVNGAESTIMHSFVMKRAGFARGQKNATHTYLARSWVHLLLLLSAP